MRLLTIALVVIIVCVQNPLWFGKGGWLKVHELKAQLAVQRDVNERARSRNDALLAEVRDLKQGYGAIEERARSELGMIREDEVFFQVVQTEVRPRVKGVAAHP